MNPVSRAWLLSRQLWARTRVKGSTVLDVGAGEHGLRGAVTLDLSGPVSIIADAADLPFQDTVFDYVVALESIEHVPDPRRILEEASRVLKRGGLLVLTTPGKSPAWRLLWFVWSNTVGSRWHCTHKSSWSQEELSRLVEENAFRVLEFSKVNWFLIGIVATKVA